ncbi:type VII secretion-associated serine protease mycosin [Mycobacterium sp. NPDC050551]|uniref:type VII secretion-associated serine protease mycosin n=1 Tax=Mycobacterium sp. NPDC050551 TaxID=3155407 RepID=UPI00341F2513
MVAAVVVGTAPLIATPVAAAVTPPAVDETLLPAPRPPAPPDLTEPQGSCLDAGDAPVAAGAPHQLDMLALNEIRPLTRGAGQTVAVIDTGVTRHRLLPHLAPGGDYVSSGDGTEDCDGHGTIVAGIVGAAASPEQAGGVAPDASILTIRQSSNRFRAVDDPGGSGYGDVETLAMAVRSAADLGATVINVSSVACLSAAEAPDDRPLGAALAYAVDVKNVVVVAAAGNVSGAGQCAEQNPVTDPGRPAVPDWESVRTVVSPAWYDDLVLTVGSVDASGAPSGFSLAGPWVDVAAPGESVVALDPDGEGLITTLPARSGDEPISGTSYAAPVVSGVAALVRSRWPQLTARQVMARIEDTARRPSAGWDPVVGHGVVDAAAAVTGTAPPVDARRAQPVRVDPPPTAADPDPRPRRVAAYGAAVCVLMAAAIALSASAGPRSGHRVVQD